MNNTSTSSVRARNKLVPELRFPEFVNEGDWVEKALNKLGKLINGLTYSPNDVSGNGLLVLRSSNIQNGQIVLNDCVYVKHGIKGANLTKPDDILVCIRNGSKALIGKNAIIPKGIPLATHGAFMTVFRAENPKFVFQLFQTDAYNYQVKADLGATINSINGGNFLKYKFKIPKLQEQQKIASCLSSLDEVIAAHSQKLEALKTHKKGLMQNLFPAASTGSATGENVPNYRFPEFVEDGGWVKQTLGVVCEIGRGKSKHRPRDASFLYGGKFPFIQTGDIRKTGLYLTEYSQTYSEEGLKQSKLWDEDTLCITIAANIAETAILKIKACFPDSIIGLVPKKNKANVLFIKYMFDNFKVQIQSLSQGVAQENLNQEKLSNIEFAFPSIIEQQKIAKCLSSLDVLITAQADKIEALKLHKKGLMQGLFPSITN